MTAQFVYRRNEQQSGLSQYFASNSPKPTADMGDRGFPDDSEVEPQTVDEEWIAHTESLSQQQQGTAEQQ